MDTQQINSTAAHGSGGVTFTPSTLDGPGIAAAAADRETLRGYYGHSVPTITAAKRPPLPRGRLNAHIEMDHEGTLHLVPEDALAADALRGRGMRPFTSTGEPGIALRTGPAHFTPVLMMGGDVPALSISPIESVCLLMALRTMRGETGHDDYTVYNESALKTPRPQTPAKPAKKPARKGRAR